MFCLSGLLEQKFSGAIQCWSTKQPVTYFGLLLPELLKESQIFIVFSSCLTQVSHYLWCLGYARLDGFVPALMGLNQLLKIMEYIYTDTDTQNTGSGNNAHYC